MTLLDGAGQRNQALLRREASFSHPGAPGPGGGGLRAMTDAGGFVQQVGLSALQDPILSTTGLPLRPLGVGGERKNREPDSGYRFRPHPSLSIDMFATTACLPCGSPSRGAHTHMGGKRLACWGSPVVRFQ